MYALKIIPEKLLCPTFGCLNGLLTLGTSSVAFSGDFFAGMFSASEW